MLSGKLSLVTGGGSGIGRAVCRLLDREGARVISADINLSSARETVAQLSGDQHLGLEVDVSSAASVSTMMSEVQRTFKAPASIVVNCAGITRDALLCDMSDEAFSQVMDVNLRGTFLVTRSAARALSEAGCGAGASIVNIASVVGKVGNIGQTNYAASKAGVEGLTRSVARELGRSGVRCNAVLPGFIDTPMVAAVPLKVMDRLRPLIPLQRTGQPEEVAELVIFLASDRASYITGASIEVTGGYGM